MDARHEANIEVLHRCLKQLFIDYLNRIGSERVATGDIERVMLSYLENGYILNFSSSVTPEKMTVVCSVNGSSLFNIDLSLGKVTYQ
ncbi:hypothetical protein [Methylotenera sp. L2L1]|uniref:hypothetical protein n=1 Tax=Methylotenera sp. L2L1 TaxID=1502770 RepID=UPI000566C502|nr:hypothetical protein [Methylotenera sp. L2L1]